MSFNMCQFLESLPWADALKSIPNIVTAITAVYGVMIAKDGLDKWRRETIGKRKTELAEEVLADFYQARDIIKSARSPLSYEHEGNTRQKFEWEEEGDARALNSYYAVAERLSKKSDFFAQLFARRYRFLALFGKEAASPYEELNMIYNKVMIAVRMLISTYRNRSQGSLPQNRQEWEATIGWVLSEEDVISKQLDRIIDEIEKVCQPVIQEVICK